ncbi:MAG: hypothetical protein ACJ766_18610 [Thermoleophilaceae bacterium]
MLRGSAIVATCLALLVSAASAEAAAVGVRPIKSCYRSGETALFAGNGFTPNGAVAVTADGASIGTLSVDNNGVFGGTLTIGLGSGEKLKTYTATDQVNPAISASTQIRVSALSVNIRPRRSAPGRKERIKARGFTTGKRLYAHVRRGHRYRKNLKLGRLKGICHKLSAKKRFFSRHARTGVYTVQFDTKRHYSRKTKVRVRYSVTLFHTIRSAATAAGSAGERWALVR